MNPSPPSLSPHLEAHLNPTGNGEGRALRGNMSFSPSHLASSHLSPLHLPAAQGPFSSGSDSHQEKQSQHRRAPHTANLCPPPSVTSTQVTAPTSAQPPRHCSPTWGTHTATLAKAAVGWEHSTKSRHTQQATISAPSRRLWQCPGAGAAGAELGELLEDAGTTSDALPQLAQGPRSTLPCKTPTVGFVPPHHHFGRSPEGSQHRHCWQPRGKRAGPVATRAFSKPKSAHI